MKNVELKRERIHHLWHEALPLLEAHWREIEDNPDIALDPDMGLFEKLEDMGWLRVYTARADTGELLGYACFIVKAHLHHRQSKQAICDAVYLKPLYRKGGLGYRLIKYADDELQREGVQVVMHHAKVAHDFGPLLLKLGYRHTENVYMRRL